MKIVPHSITRAVSRKILVTKKNSPHIFFVGGVIGVVTSTVMACRATLKLEKTVDEINQDLYDVKAIAADKDTAPVNYTEQEYRRDLLYVYGKSAVKVGKLYGPSMALGVASIGALTGSHIQLTRRNAALTVTLAAVTKAYDEYRLRVQEEIGKKRELDIYHNVYEEEVDGEKKKEVVKIAAPFGRSPYARFFDECSEYWKKNAELNRMFIECQQAYANNRLRANGHVFLNEVYDWLGLERSKEGQVVGWLYKGEGDGFIDFGIYEAHNAQFIIGAERSLILDFNVDGVIFDRI